MDHSNIEIIDDLRFKDVVYCSQKYYEKYTKGEILPELLIQEVSKWRNVENTCEKYLLPLSKLV